MGRSIASALRTGLPSSELDYHATLHRAHRALWDAGVTADFVRPDDPGLARYRAVLAPSLYLLSRESADRLTAYVAGGGRLLVEFFSGAVDPACRAWAGGFPGPLREVLGVAGEEPRPPAAGERIPLSDGSDGSGGSVWSESLSTQGARALIRYSSGLLAGRPAVTRNSYGAGSAWYLSTRLDARAYAATVAAVLREAGAGPEVAGLPAGVEAVRRHHADGRSWLFLTNHQDAAARVRVSGRELLSDRLVEPAGLLLPGRASAVVRE